MRAEHLIRSSEGARYPSQVVALDCAGAWCQDGTDTRRQVELLSEWYALGVSGKGGEYGPPVEREGRSAEDLWDAVRARCKRPGQLLCVSERAERVWALLGLWRRIEDGEASLCGTDHRGGAGDGRGKAKGTRGCCCIEGPPTIVDVRPAGCSGTLRIVDTRNWHAPGAGPDCCHRQRCQRSLDLILNMVRILRRDGMGGLSATAGSQSMLSWRHGRVGALVLAHADTRALGLEGDAYYGGRNEALTLGRLPGLIHHCDVTAMYPYCYSAHPVPCSLMGYGEDVPESDILQLAESYGVIADVTINTGEPAYPYRDANLGITVWPVGRFRTTLCWPELEDAARRGVVSAWHRAAWYAMGPALKPHAEMVFALRQETADDIDLSGWAKALGVCLLGKLGQHDRRWTAQDTRLMLPHWWSGWVEVRPGEWQRWRSVAGVVQAEERLGWAHDAVPQIAAWVTSQARRRLLEMVRMAQWAHVHYFDTDSLMVDDVGLNRLIDGGAVWPGEPGYLRVVESSEHVAIHALKRYDFGERSVCAGRPTHDSNVVPMGATVWRSAGIAGACRAEQRPESRRVAETYNPRAIYRHGRRGRSGRVEPLEYGRAL